MTDSGISRGRILIVEDDDTLRTLLSTALEAEGYDSEPATNGREALDAVARAAPDLVVLDLDMPVMDGRAFLAEYRRRSEPHPHAPIVLTSADPDPQLDGVAFLERPFELGNFLALVRASLRVG